MTDRKAYVGVHAMGLDLIVNINDYDPLQPTQGVSADILNTGWHEKEIAIGITRLAIECNKAHGRGVIIIDGGANLGHLTCFWAQAMLPAEPWGQVIAFEPQKWPYRMLVRNIVDNNCFNAEPINAALGNCSARAAIADIHPLVPHNSGGVHIATSGLCNVEQIAIDDLKLPRLDIMKLDVEGSEPGVIIGAKQTIEAFKPIIIAETFICGMEKLQRAFDGLDYEILTGTGVNALCVHKSENNPALREAVSKFKAAKAA